MLFWALSVSEVRFWILPFWARAYLSCRFRSADLYTIDGLPHAWLFCMSAFWGWHKEGRRFEMWQRASLKLKHQCCWLLWYWPLVIPFMTGIEGLWRKAGERESKSDERMCASSFSVPCYCCWAPFVVCLQITWRHRSLWQSMSVLRASFWYKGIKALDNFLLTNVPFCWRQCCTICLKCVQI